MVQANKVIYTQAVVKIRHPVAFHPWGNPRSWFLVMDSILFLSSSRHNSSSSWMKGKFRMEGRIAHLLPIASGRLCSSSRLSHFDLIWITQRPTRLSQQASSFLFFLLPPSVNLSNSIPVLNVSLLLSFSLSLNDKNWLLLLPHRGIWHQLSFSRNFPTFSSSCVVKWILTSCATANVSLHSEN